MFHSIHTTMCMLLLVCLIAGIFLSLTSPRHQTFSRFPVIYEGHTPVHQVDQHGTPCNPAYMAFSNGEPIFYKLYTNETIGSYTEYTRVHQRSAAYRRIYTSAPLYRGYTLYGILTRAKPFVPRDPLIKRIYEERRRVWWERCVRDWEDYRRPAKYVGQ